MLLCRSVLMNCNLYSPKKLDQYIKKTMYFPLFEKYYQNVNVIYTISDMLSCVQCVLGCVCWQLTLRLTSQRSSCSHTDQVMVDMTLLTLWTDANLTWALTEVNVLYHRSQQELSGGWTWQASTASITLPSTLWLTTLVKPHYVSYK